MISYSEPSGSLPSSTLFKPWLTYWFWAWKSVWLTFLFFWIKRWVFRNEVWLIYGFLERECGYVVSMIFGKNVKKCDLKWFFFSKSARCTLNSIFQKLENIGFYLYKLDYICLPDLFSLLCDVVMDKLDCCAQRPNKHSITYHIWSKEIKWKMDAVGKQGFISNH